MSLHKLYDGLTSTVTRFFKCFETMSYKHLHHWSDAEMLQTLS
jgi:hypothetical protein